jgi:hypothetical protein
MSVEMMFSVEGFIADGADKRSNLRHVLEMWKIVNRREGGLGD